MNAALDLSRRAWTRHAGILTLIGTWIEMDGRKRPCMVLIRRGEEFDEHTIPCVITLDKAWIWSEEIGDMQQCAETLAGFIDPLRLSLSTSTIHRLFSLINSHLGDLISMPPYIPQNLTTVAEMTVTHRDTGKTKEVEIRDDV